jgi:hypothetical protein
MRRGERALKALEHAWANQGAAASLRPWRPHDLARAFASQLQARPELVGARISSSNWIRPVYPLFSAAVGAHRAPPFKDFAKELATVMRRKRVEERAGGKRTGTATWYIVPDPKAMRVPEQGAHRRRHLAARPASSTAPPTPQLAGLLA